MKYEILILGALMLLLASTEATSLRSGSKIGPFVLHSKEWWAYTLAGVKNIPLIVPKKTYTQPKPPTVVLESKSVVEDKIIGPVVSSTYNSGNCRSLKLFSGDGRRSWCATSQDGSPSISLDAGKDVLWTAVATQG